MSVICRLCNECTIAKSYPVFDALTGIISIRWRKPRYVPRAKSKEFVVRKPTPIDLEESEELKTRFAHYGTTTRGIRRFIDEMIYEENVILKEQKKLKTQAAYEEELKRMLEVNERWNEKIRISREARQAAEAEGNEVKLERIRKIKQKRSEILKQQAAERLRYDTVQSESFIVPDTFEERFAEMMDREPENLEYIIDYGGNVIHSEDIHADQEEDLAKQEMEQFLQSASQNTDDDKKS